MISRSRFFRPLLHQLSYLVRQVLFGVIIVAVAAASTRVTGEA